MLVFHLMVASTVFSSLFSRSQADASGSNPLQRALLEDLIPAGSGSCTAGSTGPNAFTFDYVSNDATSDWDAMSKEFEDDAFLAEFSHVDANAAQSWKIRVGHGGGVNSFVGAYGEAMPPQKHAKAPWIDEVW